MQHTSATAHCQSLPGAAEMKTGGKALFREDFCGNGKSLCYFARPSFRRAVPKTAPRERESWRFHFGKSL
jgi:hypothetical protein